MRKVEIGRKYRHFKGNIVEVICIAKNTEDLTKMVIYKHDNDIWARPIDMFLSSVDHEKYPDIKDEYRFTLIEND